MIARVWHGVVPREIDRAQYFPFDLDCLLDPEPNVAHYEVMASHARPVS